MNEICNLAKSVAVVLLVAGAGSVVAAEIVPTTATVTVQNAFTLTEIAPLNFGTIRAQADPAGTQVATVTRPANPAVPGAASATTPAVAQILVPGEPGRYAVSGAATYANLTLTLPNDGDVELTTPAAPTASPVFILSNFSAHILTGANAGTLYGAQNLQTDVNGEVEFGVGATLSTDTATTTMPYLDAVYTGNFDVIVSY